ncbi:MAG: TIGR02281 family clan AA aspartic protease [Halofilum sp. (in: g-proteobacteria)]|nr:TIGR02281 family clan AA aspartic protease [Halofilum sp. (in: g-proteobacteria)]
MAGPLRTLAPVAAAFALLLALVWVLFGTLLEQRHHPNRGLVTGAGGPERVVLEPGPGGHYSAPGTINGHEVTFLVDTGASHVAVPDGIAPGLGLERGPQIRVATAAGTVRAWRTRIDRIAIGGLALRDVRGSINPRMGGERVLLGMSFLRHVEFRQQGERLILAPPSGADPGAVSR